MAVKLQRIPVLVVVMLGLAMGGCTLQKSEGRDDGFEPRPGTVEAMEPFHAFLDTRPTPEEFRRVYPDVTLVLPGDIATHEYRTDNSRFFAELDDDGRIVDGEFR
ncbi:hypothetical protein [Thioalkalivibrio sp. ALE23]|uniref:hypothetical protein n=1 Tax=Thioalkalivibrio sp. ALE23 TaxID=1265495 RepID=UPI0004783CB8|nr:hypothetical protein [Thioalkalivibrio sp. ALE23]